MTTEVMEEAVRVQFTDERPVVSARDLHQAMKGGESELEWRDKYKLNKLKPRIGDVVPKEFTYGYAITCHKAQGSEWGNVLVLEEKFPYPAVEHARWLYTAATRAAEKLVIVTKD